MSNCKHVEDIVDGVRKVDEKFSDKSAPPVILVASATRMLPVVQSKITGTIDDKVYKKIENFGRSDGIGSS